MISRYAQYLRDLLRQVWVRVVGFALLALLATGLARILAPYLPENLALETGSEAVESLLAVLTSSMLAVTTFSLSIAVSAFAAAAESATPRSIVLLQEDDTTQNVLATFLGAFLFGLVGLIALHAEFYGTSGKVVVFLFTVIVIGLVVVALIRWIGHLMQFGRMGDTLDRVEQAASKALQKRLDYPYLGGRLLRDAPPAGCTRVPSPRTGYIQHVDMQALQECAEEIDARLFVCHLPGAFVAPGESLVSVDAASIDDDHAETLCRAFTIGTQRSFDHDPRFGLIVLTEIASRALSPAVNDPGTAIDILGRHVRIFLQWGARTDADAEVEFDRIFVPSITVQDAFEDSFRPIARDGATLWEVQFRLQKALTTLRQSAPEVFAPACEQMAREALQRSEGASLLPSELSAIRTVASLGRCTSVTLQAGSRAPEPDPVSREI